jgi:FdrA protein
MPVTRIEIRRGAYCDSVVLMHLQRALAGLPGIVDAGVVMATPANRELLAESGLLPPAADTASADDLLIVVKGEADPAVLAALQQVDALIAARRSAAAGGGYQPKSLATALKALPAARWLAVSVPGRYAAQVARQGLDASLHIFLYSDNVAIEDEIALKQAAREKGLLVMGPDCGTAIIHGVGLGFANRVRRGNIGLVGASGTGLQAVTSAIHNLGGGVSHAIGTGGRDLKAAVGGITALQGLACLASDPETESIVLVSKPPDPEVAAKLLGAAQACGKPVVINFIGYAPPARKLGNVWFAVNLQEAAEMAVSGELSAVSQSPEHPSGCLRGLFSGGTLAVEAVLALQNVLYPLYSNVPITSYQILENAFESRAHTIIDMGDDDFTQGRLHPMMDNDLRIRRLRQEAADPEVGMILLDVVLGEGAHPDPASEFAPVIEEIIGNRKSNIEIMAVVVGTNEDPQGMVSQIERLKTAGARVFGSVASAAEHIASRGVAVSNSPNLPSPITPIIINAGLESFFASLTSQGARAVHWDWRPPAGGNERMAGLLEKLRGKG